MPHDALDPGPDGTYPHWPRREDGSWDEERMPKGLHPEPNGNGGFELRDFTPRHPDGTPIVPPGMEPPR